MEGGASASAGAVFLSYASEDGEAAQRIADGLRAAGIEVWFDRSELRGGDAWDHSIRDQIHRCKLFLPIISAHSEARDEGYFRREWALAEDRTRDMARRRAFLLPVVIDGTPERGASVPEKFLEVQWTRLPQGITEAAFVERVKRLLTAEAAPSLPPVPTDRQVVQRATSPVSLRRWWVVAAVVAALAALAVGYVKYGRRGVQAPDALSVKSIAVLPFIDMSEKHDQEYFSDGLSEELIDHLAHIPSLKVIARTSAFAFKGKNEDVRTIATKLGVTNVLEGSVRKAGSKLRIAVQLVRATDGAHVWSDTYNRDLSDIFALQDEIATTVANALNATLNATGVGSAQASSRGTVNVEAYKLLLQGNFYFWRSNQGDNGRAVEAFRQALELDPRYAPAWAKLARVYAWQTYTGELSPSEGVAKGREAVQRALAIDPKCAEAYYARGNIARLVDGDWSAAMSDFERAATLDPNGDVGDSARSNRLTLVAELTGNFDAVLAWDRQRLERNPLDTDTLANLAALQQWVGRLEESATTSRKLLDLNPAFAVGPAPYAVTLLLMGKKEDAVEVAKRESDEANKLAALAYIYWSMDRRTESDSALAALERGFSDRNQYLIAAAHAYRGEADAAFRWLDRAYQHSKGSLEPLKVDIPFRKLHGDPRFATWLRKAKLVE